MLRVLFEGCDGYAFALSHMNGSFRNDWKRVQADLDPIVQAIQVINETKSTCAYLSANVFSPQNNHGRRVKDVLALRALVVDIDFSSDEPGVRGSGKKGQCVPVGNENLVDEALRELHATGHLSFVVDSGHGRQAWLLLPKPWSLESNEARARAIGLSKGFSRYMNLSLSNAGVKSGVDGSPNIERIWRVAGSVNWKGVDPVPVTMFLPDNGVRLEVDEIQDVLLESGIELELTAVEGPSTRVEELTPLSEEGMKRLDVALENHSGFRALWNGDAEKAKSLMPEITDTSGSGCMFHFARILAQDFKWCKRDVRAALVSVAKEIVGGTAVRELKVPWQSSLMLGCHPHLRSSKQRRTTMGARRSRLKQIS